MRFIFLSLTLLFNLAFHNAKAEQSMISDNSHDSPPKFLYKIISTDDWQKSMQSKSIVLSPIDKDFIHLAEEEQISHIVQKFWFGKNYVLLKLAANKLKGRLIYERNPGGKTKYFHLYEGGIFFDAVLEATVVKVTR
ncbi:MULTISPECIES: DUF952 domain-containing protein [Parachlamydia]|jgi:uncharacterized protein (DUF952 family)|uniref:Uncharacterized protein n=2 Tax=Parachlamydia acanthamoebae TaxID=83552 RepID=F8L1A9_PARAV|nr:DUF952 domain-containing protein [Parachlamydia acanthamoebae]EFB40658.1 hypothetical protein pah_c197o040 [Parachlamydia acanthamoebae str. Hall's coccus]CCB87039.1 putative uncharacterized protein [Parachlamydia acanthamoebae UV-7]